MVTVKDYSESAGQGVVHSLDTMSVTREIMDYMVKHREEWKTFGKMNSHLYRAKLFKAMDEAKLNPEARVLVYMMASIIKSQPRIVEAMTNFPEDKRLVAQGVWFAVRDFFDNRCTQYVSASKKNKKFPVVNLPGTLPGMDILCFALTTLDHERTYQSLCRRPTFTQLALKPEVQTDAKEGYEYYWTKIVKGSKNTDKVEAPSMNQDYYNTAAGDEYYLISLDSSQRFSEKKPADEKNGYSRSEVEHYLRSFDTHGHSSSHHTESPPPPPAPSSSSSKDASRAPATKR